MVRDGAGVAVPPEPMDLAEVAQLALGLPEAVEQDHHGMRSFRIDGKIFATVPDEQHVRIMVDQEDILAAVAENRRLAPKAGGASASRAWSSRSNEHPVLW